MLNNLIFTYKNEIRMITGYQERSGIQSSRRSIKEVYSAHNEPMEINGVPSCAIIAMNNIHGYMNSWKVSLN